jgi:RHS repeat-associated protein
MSLPDLAALSLGAARQPPAVPPPLDDASGNAPAPLPAVTQPKGGGAIRGIGETFSVGGPTGTSSVTIPVAISPARQDFAPKLSLAYSSGTGNGHFGFGWQLSTQAITRKTDKGLPRYDDADFSDIFMLAGMDDLVPTLEHTAADSWIQARPQDRRLGKQLYHVSEYRPRIEGLFSRIERWALLNSGETHWRTISKDNVTMLFGESNESRIYDPRRPDHVFSWLLSQTFDDKGNVMQFRYKSENDHGINLAQAHERYRLDSSRTVERYLKGIKYGNSRPRHIDPSLESMHWHFEVTFDYGEHDKHFPTPLEVHPWKVRPDPFSTYRAGFEVRTYRRCERVLMFHHFPEEAISINYLVNSLDLEYQDDQDFGIGGAQVASLIKSATQRSYAREDCDRLVVQSMPPVEFEYTTAEISPTVQEMHHGGLENLPVGVDGTAYQWLDLNAEGLPGVLSQQGLAYFYKPNLGNGRLGPTQILPTVPSLEKDPGRQLWLDLSGDGRLDLVHFANPSPGFYKRDWDLPGKWDIQRAFRSLPNIPWNSSKVRMVDVTGDGLADTLLTDDENIIFYPSLGEFGFGTGQYKSSSINESTGPRLLLADETETIHLADMSGDGLSDLVRVRNGEICYWPNLGYGNFGPKVAMDDSPFFEKIDIFKPRRIILADVDGSGTTDLIFLHENLPVVYLNQAGNSWSAPSPVHAFPQYNDSLSINVVDLLGHGTGCLVWSSVLPSDSGRQMRYIDLMSTGKPYLLTAIKNNLGLERHVEYASSTQFFLDDQAAGRPWLTRLPFPVQVVKRVKMYDRISGNRMIQNFKYHEGFFDPFEREFRGFGVVETIDSENFGVMKDLHKHEFVPNFDPTFHTPPVLTKRWYDTGAYLRGVHIARKYQTQYYEEPKNSNHSATLLPWSSAPSKVRVGDKYISYDPLQEEIREAYRSLKGQVLREEIYGLDGTEHEQQPYQVTQTTYTIDFLQPRGFNRHAIFFSHLRESVKYNYERNRMTDGQSKPDPHASHTLNLLTNPFGNVIWSVNISYGRRHEDKSRLLKDVDRRKQREGSITLNVDRYTNTINEIDAYRIPLICDSRKYQLVNFPIKSDLNLVQFSTAFSACQYVEPGGHDIPFEDFAAKTAKPGEISRRLLTRNKISYRSDDLTKVLPFGRIEPRAMVHETYDQVFTPSLLEEVYNSQLKISSDNLNSILEREGGYVQLPGDQGYWKPSGQVFYSPGKNDTFTDEGVYAAMHFYQPGRFRNPFYSASFDTEISVRFDNYDLLVIESRDAEGNVHTAGERNQEGRLLSPSYDYRVLKPTLIMEPNRNRVAMAYDVRGMLTASAVMGKPEEKLGDLLSGFKAFLSEQEKVEYFQKPTEKGPETLGNATKRFIYDDLAYYRTRSSASPLPPSTGNISREAHVSDLREGQISGLQQAFQYAAGMGQEIQTKVQADPDPMPRWAVSGWKVFDNKGNAVRQYEAIYTHTHEYQPFLREGVCSTHFYDPMARPVATLFPNHTWIKTVRTAWSEELWDDSDTVLLNPLTDIDVEEYFQRLDQRDFLPTWYDARIEGQMGRHEKIAVEKTSVFAATPSIDYKDPLGHTILTVLHNRCDHAGSDEFITARNDVDISGNVRRNHDALERTMEVSDFDMLNNVLCKATMEAGKTWALHSVVEKPVHTWNSRDVELSTTYDLSTRPLETFLCLDGVGHSMVSRIIYGESLPDAERFNLRMRTLEQRDQGGIKRTDLFDFKGNPVRLTEQLAKSAAVIDWSANVSLEKDVYVFESTYDAVNRAIRSKKANGTLVRAFFTKLNQPLRIELKPGSDLGSDWVTILGSAEYNARNQLVAQTDGNGVQTTYSLDPFTFRLSRVVSKKRNSNGRTSRVFQDLSYTYDAGGNVTYAHDGSQDVIFFRNQRVEPSSVYTYDAVYRLIEATGREHLGQDGSTQPYGQSDAHLFSTAHQHDQHAMGRYTEYYKYDVAGNILSLRHQSEDPSRKGWTRHYSYKEASQLEKHKFSNRLSSTVVGSKEDFYRYDGPEGLMGDITSMTGLPKMMWDFRDQLQATATQRSEATPAMTWYSYNDAGQRVRKQTYSQAGPGAKPRLLKERLYLGFYEVYREFDKDGEVCHETHTLDISKENRRIALIEMPYGKTERQTLFRYQLGNYLGSAVTELDEQANVITYEEYYPFGSSSYRASRSQTEAPKRYRYSAKEHDKESGLYYYGARYYASWLGRWISADPGGITEEDSNSYQFVKSNPITYRDPDGKCGVAEVGALVVLIGTGLMAAWHAGRAAAPAVARAGTSAVHYATEASANLNLRITRAEMLSLVALIHLSTKVTGLFDHPPITVPPPPVVAPRPSTPNPPVPVTTNPPPTGLDIPVEIAIIGAIILNLANVKPTTRTKFGRQKPRDEDHHVYPKNFAWFFKLVGINIHDRANLRRISDAQHDYIHNVLRYNLLWKLFILLAVDWQNNKLRPGVTKEMVEAYARYLEVLAGTTYAARPIKHYEGFDEFALELKAIDAAKAAGLPSPVAIPNVVQFILGKGGPPSSGGPPAGTPPAAVLADEDE